MKRQLLHLASTLWSAKSGTVGALSRRQADGATAASTFLRRAYQASCVAGSYVYIDGGEFSILAQGSIDWEYSNTILSIDLSQDWTNSSVVIQSTSKPDDVPDLVQAGLWYDEKRDILYSGFAGRISFFGYTPPQDPYPNGVWSFKPDGQGGGSWDTVIKSSSDMWKGISRPYMGLISYGAGKGYVLGGSHTDKTAPDSVDLGSNVSYGSGLLEFDFETQKLTNVSVTTPRSHGFTTQGRMQYVPTFGQDGIFVAMSGNHVSKTNQDDNLLDFNTVSVFDPSSGSWYDQETTGNIPEARKEFCTAGVASANGTYEIFMYAGWGGHLGPVAIPFDSIYILTLPAFYWIKVNYPAEHPRHALSCEAVGGSQILTIGGIDTTSTLATEKIYFGPFNTSDPFSQGLNIFNMTSLQFEDKYTANAPSYVQSDAVASYYASSPEKPNYNSTTFAKLLQTVNLPNTTSSTLPSSPAAQTSSASSSSSSSSSSSNTGAIVGGVVGGILGLALVAGIGWFFLQRQRKYQRARQTSLIGLDNGTSSAPAEMGTDRPIQEMYGDHGAKEKPPTPVHHTPIELP